MMTIEDAILKANEIYISGWETQQREIKSHPDTAQRALQEADRDLRLREYVEELSTHRSGQVSVKRTLERAVGVCPYCGTQYSDGYFLVRHDDGREIRFDIGLVHYVQEGHLISVEDIDIDAMTSIMADA
jgi:hypothetical protein